MANTMSDVANKAAWLTEAKANPLKVDHAPMPKPGADEVVIKNAALVSILQGLSSNSKHANVN